MARAWGIDVAMVPLGIVAAQLLLAGCVAPVDFPCERDEQCDVGKAPACVEGYCAVEDTACESGYRFGDHGPQAGLCASVPSQTGATDPSQSSTTDPSPTSATDPAGSTAGSSGDSVGTGLEPPVCVAEVRAQAAHACARYSDGRVYCWGDTTGGVARTVAPGVIEGVVADALSVDSHACYRSQQDGSANCWGDNSTGAIDPTGPGSVFPPHRLLDSNLSNTNVVAVGSGLRSTCVAESSEVFCRGTVAAQTGADSPLPGGAVPTAVAVGREHVCVVDDAGEVWCAGSNEFAQLGTLGTSEGFGRVPIPPGAQRIAAHRDSTCAITSDGLWCWGRNSGHVAPGGGPTAPPTRVAPDSEAAFMDVAMGPGTTCAIGDDAFFYCWGDPLCGDLEFAGVQRLEFLGDAASGASSITLGSAFMCFIADDRVYCWGNDETGQLGGGGSGESCVTALREVPLGCS